MKKRIRTIRTVARLALAVFVCQLASACSSESKSPVAKKYHSFVSYFNGFYNATQKYKEGVRSGDKDLLIPEADFLIPGLSAKTASAGASFSLFDEASLKCDVIIFRHKNGSFVDDSYLLRGKCAFQKGDYTNTNANLEYILKKFPDTKLKPEVYLWLAKTAYGQGYVDKSREYIQKAGEAGEISDKAKPELAQMQAAAYIQDKKYNEAIMVLEQNISYVRSKKQRSVWHYLLGQLYDAVGQFPKSFENFQAASRIDQYNELTFRSQLNIAQLYVKYQQEGAQSEAVEKTLKAMLKEKKFEDYRDQIYYQYAQLALKKKDYKNGLKYLKASLAAGGKNQTQRTRSYFETGRIYFYQFEKLDSAQAYFDSAAKIVPPTFKDLVAVKNLAATLKQYGTNKQTIHEQDSLLALSKLSEADLKKYIEKVVADEEKRRIEKKQKEAREAQMRMNQMQNQLAQQQLQVDATQTGTTGPVFYFEDRQRVARGIADFQRVWGQRILEDNWRRKNKDLSEQGPGEIAAGSYKDPEDSLKQLNLRKEKYFARVPRTDSAITAAHNILRSTLFDQAQLYAQKLEMPDSAVVYYAKVVKRYPDHDDAPKALYGTYTLYTDQKQPTEAEKVKQRILNDYPNSVYSRLLRKENVSDVTDADKKAFTAAYNELYKSYTEEKYAAVVKKAPEVAQRFKTHPDVAQVYYIRGASYGKMNQEDSLVAIYTDLIKAYPDAEVTKVAKATLAYLKKGNIPPEPITRNNPSNPGTTTDTAKTRTDPLTGFSPRKGTEPLNVVLLIDKSKIKATDLTLKAAKFNESTFANEKLQATPFDYISSDKKVYHCLYIRSFGDYTLAENYLTQILANPEIGGLVDNKQTEAFFINLTNFRVGLSKKRFHDYGQYFLKYKAEIKAGTK